LPTLPPRYAIGENITQESVDRIRLALQLWSDMNQLTAEYANLELGYDNFLVVRKARKAFLVQEEASGAWTARHHVVHVTICSNDLKRLIAFLFIFTAVAFRHSSLSMR